MAKGLLILLWVIICIVFFQKHGQETEPVCVSENYYIRRAKVGYAIIIFLLPFAFAAFRTSFIDTDVYITRINAINTDVPFDSIIYVKSSENYVFFAFEYVIKKYVSSDPQFFLFFVALIQSILLVVTLRRYSENLGMSIYVFIASALYFNWLCNGIRQFLAVVILFALSSCIVKNKWYIYLPVVLFLSGLTPIYKLFGGGVPPWLFSGIHQSALLMIPVFFLVRGKALTKKVWLLMVVLLVLALFGLLDNVLETTTQNTVYAEDLSYVSNTRGANPIRFFVSLAPIVLVLLKRKEIISDTTPPIINLAVNMSFVSSTLYLASVFTSGIFVGRLPIYCELYNLILIPWLVNHIYTNDKRVLSCAIYIFYFLFFLYQCFIAWGNQVYTVELFGLTI